MISYSSEELTQLSLPSQHNCYTCSVLMPQIPSGKYSFLLGHRLEWGLEAPFPEPPENHWPNILVTCPAYTQC